MIINGIDRTLYGIIELKEYKQGDEVDVVIVINKIVTELKGIVLGIESWGGNFSNNYFVNVVVLLKNNKLLIEKVYSRFNIRRR